MMGWTDENLIPPAQQRLRRAEKRLVTFTVTSNSTLHRRVEHEQSLLRPPPSIAGRSGPWPVAQVREPNVPQFVALNFGGRGPQMEWLTRCPPYLNASAQSVLDQSHLYAIEHNFRAAAEMSKVANDEIRWKLGEYALGTGSKIEEPKVLVPISTSKESRAIVGHEKTQPVAPARQQHARQRIGRHLRRRLARKGRPDVCA